ncbi:MAG TPA: redoxin domain-containing protein [Longimicrobiaceae bacterium]|nr:redoxin domain-containing protein [Longimicrobiaceae bacterium]
MTPRFAHPGFRRLSLFVDGDLDGPAHRKVARHLESCPDCRAAVARIRLLDGEARSLPAPPLPPGSLERVLERWEGGERVLLPAADPPRPLPARRRWWAAAAAVVAAVLAGAPLLSPGAELEANRSELVFAPAAPQRGAVVHVTYRSGSLLAGEDRLRLRARYLRHDDPPVPGFGRQTVAAELVRRDDGTFQGRIRLPGPAVYAVFAVEDTAGARVDSDGGRLWELLVHAPDGRPALEALLQREFDHLWRVWEHAHENSRRAAALYPDRVVSWFNLYLTERQSLAGPAEDSARARARARLAEFDRRLRPRTGLDAETELGIMVRFADEAGDTALYRHWRERLLREAPNSLWGVQERAIEVAARGPDRALAGLDTLWSRAGAGHGALVLLPVAFGMAEHTGDPETIRRWAGRILRHGYDPDAAGYLGAALARHPALREEGMAMLRRRLRELERVDEAVRPLESSVAEERRARREAAGRVLASLGAALLESGRREAALDTLARATEIGWDAALFRQVAALRLASGDTAGAVRPLALAAVDPLEGGAVRDSARVLLGSHHHPAAWREGLASARREMRERLRSDAVARRLPGDVDLRDPDGRAVELRGVAAGRPTFVAFWSRFCPASAAQVPLLQRVAAAVRAEGHAVVTVSEAPTPGFRRYLQERGITVPVYTDPAEELDRALGRWGTPAYYVLDGRGRVRWGPIPSSHLARVPALMALLAEETAAD